MQRHIVKTIQVVLQRPKDISVGMMDSCIDASEGMTFRVVILELVDLVPVANVTKELIVVLEIELILVLN